MKKEPNKKPGSILEDFIRGYEILVRKGFDERWNKVEQGIYESYVSESIGALLSRQATLSLQMAFAPTTWNVNVAPLFIRCMIDVYVTLAWIFIDPPTRSKKYIEYGLGQEKLHIEFLKKSLENESDVQKSEALKKMIDVNEAWLNGQQAEWFTEVNVGSWSGISTREMTKEIEGEDIYNLQYVPLSGAAHNMWQFVGRYNVETCSNPLHKWHAVPKIYKSQPDPNYIYGSAMYLSMTYKLFDEKMNIECNVTLPVQYLSNHEIFSAEKTDKN